MQSPITEKIVRQLIAGCDIEILEFYDVSDTQIYGRKHLRRLTGSLADAAQDAGCEPIVYQAVLWWCLVFIPFIPLKVYFVIPCLECDDHDGDAEQYRGLRTQWDAMQVAAHYCISALLFAVSAAGLWWLLDIG